MMHRQPRLVVELVVRPSGHRLLAPPHQESTTILGKNSRVPDFVFLAHVVDVSSCMHVQFYLQSFASMPFTTRLFLVPCWPFAFMVLLAMWVWSKTFLVSFYYLRGQLHQTWVVPRCGFQYFLPFATEGINKQIEHAILRADRIGVEVISLAALNKQQENARNFAEGSQATLPHVVGLVGNHVMDMSSDLVAGNQQFPQAI